MWRGELTEAIEEGAKRWSCTRTCRSRAPTTRWRCECAGRLDEALEQYQLGSVMSLNLPWMRALEATCLAKMGRLEDARHMSGTLEQLRRTEVRGRILHGDTARRARPAHGGVRGAGTRVPQNSAFLYQIEIDPKMERLRDDARFARVSSRDGKAPGKTR